MNNWKSLLYLADSHFPFLVWSWLPYLWKNLIWTEFDFLNYYKVPSVSMMKNFGAMKDIRAAHTNSLMEDVMSNWQLSCFDPVRNYHQTVIKHQSIKFKFQRSIILNFTLSILEKKKFFSFLDELDHSTNILHI